MLSDLDFVGSVGSDAANRPFTTPWERVQHEGAVRIPYFRRFIVERRGGGCACIRLLADMAFRGLGAGFDSLIVLLMLASEHPALVGSRSGHAVGTV